MIKKRHLFFTLLLLFCFNNSINAQSLWNQLATVQYLESDIDIFQRKTVPKNYKLFALDLDNFEKSYTSKSIKSTQTVELPNAKGELKRFEMVELSNFESGLQAKFPKIKSYTAKGIDDPTAVAKISVGVDGFHGVIFSGDNETVYIDPFSKDKKSYIIYERNSLPKKDEEFKCLVEGNNKQEFASINAKKSSNNGVLRTYRIAIASSGEYSEFHLERLNIQSIATEAEKKAAVLSAMNTSMTRINGVFERDLGIRMVIVNDNDKIIFLDEVTDGITDGDADAMIDEVQVICDAQIGDANYDIGHVFSIGGAGLAGLGVVCVTGRKGSGVTGIGSPVNDPYDIDYVAHEIGHQFGATHTQNNDCNRTNATAVEPGSGSTIMGYAGVCSPNVLGVGSSGGNSDDHFHAASIAQMLNVVENSGNCALVTNTNNANPTADAGANYSIPKSTPFILTGVGADEDGVGSLTYNWEQVDNEIGSMPPSETNGQGPMFRSLPSKTESKRYFPALETIIAGNLKTEWEVLPAVERDMNFSFLVRDNNAGGGSTARDDMSVSVIDTTPFTVVTPETAVSWDAGSEQTILWEKGNTDISPINCTLVNIKLSVDGGLTFPIVLKSNTPNDGTENVIIPNNATTNARIMVEAVGNIFYNVNASDFVIKAASSTFIITTTSEDQIICSTSNQPVSYILNFDFVRFSETVNLSASGQPVGSNVVFSPSSLNKDGNVTMTISNLNGVAAQDYVVKVLANSSSVNKEFDVNMFVKSDSFNSITLMTPEDKSTNIPLTQTLNWQSDTNATSYEILLAKDINFTDIVTNQNVATNSFTANDLDELTQYFWKVKPKNDCGEGAFSSIFSFTTACLFCNSTGNMDFDTSITLVNFNTINNSSSKTQPYTDYTAISTDVKRGNEYDLSVNLNTDGNYRILVKVWIDWNGDCTFNDSDEEYDLESATNTEDGPTSNSPLTITIPANAILGSTRLRVSSKYTEPGESTYPEACELGFDGEVEDYTINIQEATASIEDNVFKNFNLFPNPSNGTFTLNFKAGNNEQIFLELYDIRGRFIEKIKFKNTDTYFSRNIDFSNVSKGLYLLKVKNGSLETHKKVVIN